MTVLRRSYDELEDALGNALTRIEELESATDELDDVLTAVRAERDEAIKQAGLAEERAQKLERALDTVVDTVENVVRGI